MRRLSGIHATARRLFAVVLVLGCSAVGVRAQSGAAVTPVLRSEGFNELTGDLILQVGVGAAFTQSNATGHFFGPGTAGGIFIGDNSWNSALVLSGGAFLPLAPNWYAGIVVDVTTPSGSVTNYSLTNNGIPGSSQFQQG